MHNSSGKIGNLLFAEMIYFVEGNIFNSVGNFSYAQCISQDAAMFRGVSLGFMKVFPELKKLRERNILGTLGFAFPVKTGSGFVYNLVTKKYYYGKPTIGLLHDSLVSMHHHALDNGVHGIKMPLLGSGCDKLNFCEDVFPLLLNVFGCSAITVEIYYLEAPSQLRSLFREMDVDRKIRGLAYVARIKSVDAHQGVDEAYGIVYQGKETVAYGLFNSICSIHNEKFFYTRKVNPDVGVFTMRECLDAVQNFPMVGTTGVSMLEFPMTFKEFGEFAYQNGVLSSSGGFEVLSKGKTAVSTKPETVLTNDVDVEHHPTVEKVPASTVEAKTAKKVEMDRMLESTHKAGSDFRVISEDAGAYTESERQRLGVVNKDGGFTIVHETDIPHSNEEVLGGNAATGYTNLTMESLRDRCNVAETKNASLELLVKEKDEVIDTLKTKLESIKESNTKFMSSNDLLIAEKRARRSDSAAEVVDGLKDEFGLIKGMSSKIAGLSSVVTAKGDDHTQLMTEIIGSLEDLPNRLARTFAGYEATVNSNSQILAGNVKMVWSVLEDFGISKNNPHVDIPGTLASLARVEVEPVPVPQFDASSQTYSLPGYGTAEDDLAVNGLSRWTSVAKPSTPAPRMLFRKPFNDYVSLEEDDDVREVGSDGGPKQAGMGQFGPLGASSSRQSFLLHPDVTSGNSSGQGMLPTPLVNNNPHTTALHFARGGAVWAQPPRSLKRGSDHLEQQRPSKWS